MLGEVAQISRELVQCSSRVLLDNEMRVVVYHHEVIGRGVKLETNLKLGVNPQDATDVRKADVSVGFSRRF